MRRVHSAKSILRPLLLTTAVWLLVSEPVPAQVTVLTVGPNGAFANIQGAIDAAVIGDDTEIRVERDVTYFESLAISSMFAAGSLRLLGGWDATFTDRDVDPALTIIDGDGDRVLDILIGGDSFEIDGFTLTNGVADQGAGIFVLPGADATVLISNNLVINNTAITPLQALGGGLWAELSGSQQLEVLDTRFQNNQATSTGGGSATGGGLGISATGGTFLIQDCMFEENSLDSSGTDVRGAGVNLVVTGSAQGELLDSYSVGNSATGGNVTGVGGYLWTSGQGVLNVERTAWALNTSSPGSSSQVTAIGQNGQLLRISDSGIVQGDHQGILAQAILVGDVHLINLTVAGNSSTGVVLGQTDSAVLTLYNTISFDNGLDLSTSGTVDTGSNLIGADPLFVNPIVFDYRLRPGSPALDAGDNAPPGGLGSADLDGNPRILNGIVDIGALEGPAEVVFSDDFESGDTLAWSRAQSF